MRWIKEHKLLTGILGTVFLLCIMIIVSYLTQGSTSPIGRQIERATSFIQRPLALAAFEVRDGVIGFRRVLAENEELRQEISELRAQNMRYRMTEDDLEELRRLAAVLNHEIMTYEHEVVTANIISLDGTNWFNVFTINRGTNDGVYENAVVMNGDGLVGIVDDAGANSSRVIAVIDTTSQISFIVARDSSMLGLLWGDGNGALEGFMLDSQAGVVEGDILLTSGKSPMFPRGIELGRVTSIYNDPNTLSRTVTVEPAVSFGNLRKVAVIL